MSNQETPWAKIGLFTAFVVALLVAYLYTQTDFFLSEEEKKKKADEEKKAADALKAAADALKNAAGTVTAETKPAAKPAITPNTSGNPDLTGKPDIAKALNETTGGTTDHPADQHDTPVNGSVPSTTSQPPAGTAGTAGTTGGTALDNKPADAPLGGVAPAGSLGTSTPLAGTGVDVNGATLATPAPRVSTIEFVKDTTNGIRQGDDSRTFQISEVVVNAKDSVGNILKLTKDDYESVSLSSAYPNGQFPASMAVDGILQTASANYWNFSHTYGEDPVQKLTLKLKDPRDITRVIIYNRQDCCQERLRDVKVNMLDINGSVITSFTLTARGVQAFTISGGLSSNYDLPVPDNLKGFKCVNESLPPVRLGSDGIVQCLSANGPRGQCAWPNANGAWRGKATCSATLDAASDWYLMLNPGSCSYLNAPSGDPGYNDHWCQTARAGLTPP